MKPVRSTKVQTGTASDDRKRIELRTVGGLTIRASGEDLTKRMGARHRALVAYLVHEGRPMDPTELIGLIGRGGDEASELSALQRAVSWLSKNVPALKIELNRGSVSLGARVWWDVRELDEAIDRRDMRAVTRLYRGDFLDGFSCGNAAFDAWAREQRQRLREYWDGAIRAAAAECESGGRWPQAADWWRLLAERNPLVADLSVRAMRAYGRARQRGEAARVYEEYLANVAARNASPDNSVEQVASDLSIPRPTHPVAAASAPPKAAAPRTAPKKPARSRVIEPGVVEPRWAEPRVIESLASEPEKPASVGQVSFGPPTSRASTDPSAALAFDDDDDDGPVSIVPGKIHRIGSSKSARSSQNGGVFTDSVLLHSTRTWWARLTTPRALRAYKNAIEQFIASTIAAAQAALYWVGVAGQASWKYGGIYGKKAAKKARRGAQAANVQMRAAARSAGAGARNVGRATAHSVAAAGAAGGRAGRDVSRGVSRGAALAVRPLRVIPWLGRSAVGLVAMTFRLFVKALKPLLAIPGLLLRALRIVVTLPFKALSALRPRRRTRAFEDVPAARSRAGERARSPEVEAAPPPPRPSSPPPPVSAPRRAWTRAEAVPRATPEAPAPAVDMPTRSVERDLALVEGPGTSQRFAVRPTVFFKRAARAVRAVGFLFRGRRAVLSGAAVVVVALAVTPAARDLIVSLVGGVRERVASLSGVDLPVVKVPTVTVRKPELPRVSVPKVTLPKPDLAGSVPSVIMEPVERLGAMLSGPLLGFGERVVISDFDDEGVSGPEGLGHLASLLLEAELAGSRHFSVLSRERALLAADRSGRGSFALPGSEAVALAPEARAVAVITGLFNESEDGALSQVELVVLEVATGEEAHRVTVDVEDGDWIVAVQEAARRLSQRLGDGKTGGSRTTGPVLSASLPALGAYARARAELFRGRYSTAAARVAEATREDSTFAAGYQLQAQVQALRGLRSDARASLEAAYRHRDHLNDREMLRVLADREALTGRHSAAIIAYEHLFQNYRDDVSALKSLALLQRRVGARGNGDGQLLVAYSIDPTDWPPLTRIARYLGFGGSFAAAASRAARPGTD